LKTFCGTKTYLAPEVYQRQKYTPAIDIWSFGLVVYGCALPRNKKNYKEREWCEWLVDTVNDQEDGDLIDLLSSAMVIMEPKSRRSAQHCYKEASRLIASYEQSLTPTPSSYGYNPVSYYATEEQAVRVVNQYTSSNVVSTAEHFYLEDVVEQMT
jgi:serine/threonine protein kinase